MVHRSSTVQGDGDANQYSIRRRARAAVPKHRPRRQVSRVHSKIHGYSMVGNSWMILGGNLVSPESIWKQVSQDPER